MDLQTAKDYLNEKVGGEKGEAVEMTWFIDTRDHASTAQKYKTALTILGPHVQKKLKLTGEEDWDYTLSKIKESEDHDVILLYRGFQGLSVIDQLASM